MVFVSNMTHFHPFFAIALLRSSLNGRSHCSYILERCGSKKKSRGHSTFRSPCCSPATCGGNFHNNLGAERAREIAEAPPVADEARRFRGSAPVFTTNGSENRLTRRCLVLET